MLRAFKGRFVRKMICPKKPNLVNRLGDGWFTRPTLLPAHNKGSERFVHSLYFTGKSALALIGDITVL
jgi:hypothetical protein